MTYKHSELTGQIIKAFYQVYTRWGMVFWKRYTGMRWFTSCESVGFR
jgi:hypothetical protein